MNSSSFNLQNKRVLVTGGAGFIGSHTALELQNAGCKVTIIDNLTNSKTTVLDRINELSETTPVFIKTDIRDTEKVTRVMKENDIEDVIHFAGLKAVGESTQIPDEYYDVNFNGTVSLLNAMKEAAVKSLIFSSSATVYGENANPPLTETLAIDVQGISHAYGRSKAMIELMLEDYTRANKDLSVTCLRYFNPVGAHPSGKMGEDPKGLPNNLMPFVSQVAVGKREKLTVFGNDYNTPDGTCLRDYLHVCDLAEGHLAALDYRIKKGKPGLEVFNFGTGKPSSVLEVIKAFEKASGKNIPYDFGDRRPGDVPSTYADPVLAKEKLGWETKYTLDEMCKHSWNWQNDNPDGYPDS